MSYLNDDEHRILLAALRREKEFCSRQLTNSTRCVAIVQSLEKKFYHDRFEQEIRDKAIDEFAEKLKEKAEGMVEGDCGGINEMSYERAYNRGLFDMEDAIDEVAEKMKEVRE